MEKAKFCEFCHAFRAWIDVAVVVMVVVMLTLVSPGLHHSSSRRKPTSLSCSTAARRLQVSAVYEKGTSSSEFKNKAMEAVKLAINLGCAATQNAIAITAEKKHHSYAQLLRSAFELSSLLQSDGRDTDDRVGTNGHHDSGEEGFIGLFKVAKRNGHFGRSKKPGKLNGLRVGIMAKPCAEFVASVWATWLNGAVAVPLALSYPEAELAHVLTDADISIVVSTEEYREVLEGVAKKCSTDYLLLPAVPSIGNSLEEDVETTPFEVILSEIESVSAGLEGDKAALILYTSGTTGMPKGVVHTHSSIGAQIRMLAEAWEYTHSDRFLHCLPLHHVHGMFNALLAPLFVGASVHFMPKFSVRGVWQQWRESYPLEGGKSDRPITVFTGVPTIYVRLLQGYDAMDAESQKACSRAARQLRLMMCGSAALPEPVMERWEGVTGHRLLERYGMTEFIMSLSNPLHGERRAGFVGMPLPGVKMLIAEEEGGEPGVGELCIKTPAMFQEYWRKPEVTKDSFREDGYFKTGDTVTVVDGYVKILGRTSVDIVKSGGYKLSALEIEAVLLQHPDIAECAVMGLPDKTYGELISAVVVPTEGAAAEANAKSEPIFTLQSIRKWAQERMAPYKIPQQLHVWETLPRNAMGKINKKELKIILLKNADI